MLSPRILGFAAMGFVALCASLVLFWNLGIEPLQNYDEASYAQIAREGIANHSFFNLTYAGKPDTEKPPLAIWLMEASQSAISSPELGARFPSAFAALALIIIVMCFAAEVSGSKLTGALAGAVLTTTGAFIEPARQARVDIVLLLFITLAVYFFWKGLRQPKWFLVSGAAFGAAILTKDVIAIFVLIGICAITTYSKQWHRIRGWYLWGGIGLATLIALPWHLYETWHYGSMFWQSYIGHEVIARTSNSFFVLQPTNSEYFSYLFSFAYPWPSAFLASVILMIVLWKKVLRDTLVVFWSSALVILSVITIFCIAHTKAFSYLLPLYPFLALCIALAVHACYRSASTSMRIVLSAALLMALTLGMYTTLWDGWHQNPYYFPEIKLAQEEKTVGTQLIDRGSAKVYVSDTVDLGSIIFYSGDTHPLLLTATSTPAVGDFIIMPPNVRPQFFAERKTLSTDLLYGGTNLLLLKVLSEN